MGGWPGAPRARRALPAPAVSHTARTPGAGTGGPLRSTMPRARPGGRTTLPAARAHGPGRSGPGLPAAQVAACGGWRPLQAAPGRTPGASAAGAAARRCQCHGVRRGARGRVGGRPPAPSIPAARPPHAALTLERRRRIEELSRSSRQRLLQSRDRMFSKFTSILQHAVEAVRPPAGPATPRRGCEPGLAAQWAPRGGAAGLGGARYRSLSAVPLPRGVLPGQGWRRGTPPSRQVRRLRLAPAAG